jgi:hypothetical protein
MSSSAGGVPNLVRIFLSWAHEDATAKAALMAGLCPHLTSFSDLKVEVLGDDRLLIGHIWHPSLTSMMDSSQYGLLLISAAFLASSYITEQELPRFVGGSATGEALPVLLKPLPMDGSRDLAGIEKLQIFRGRQGQAFTETAGAGRDRFICDLASEIRNRIIGS